VCHFWEWIHIDRSIEPPGGTPDRREDRLALLSLGIHRSLCIQHLPVCELLMGGPPTKTEAKTTSREKRR